ncbi:MAG: YerC/YecD family TrpR-related protein [Ornithinimicrobium sp.]
MKQRTTADQQSLEELSTVLAALTEPADVESFLIDLCTPAELEALADRWVVVPLLAQGVPYRTIHDQTGVSVTTIGRVARCLEQGTGYRAALERHTASPR